MDQKPSPESITYQTIMDAIDDPKDIEFIQLTPQQHREMRLRRYESCGIPKNMWDIVPEMWEKRYDASGKKLPLAQAKAKDHALEVTEQFIRVLPWLVAGRYAKYGTPPKSFNSLSILGGTHSGKSMLAAIVAKEAIAHGLTVRYFSWTDLLLNVRGDYSTPDLITSIDNAIDIQDLVVVDGVESIYGESPKDMTLLRSLMNKRVQKGKPYIVTAYDFDLNEGRKDRHPMSAWLQNDLTYNITLP